MCIYGNKYIYIFFTLHYIYARRILRTRKMNASDWEQAAKLVSQQQKHTATADTSQLSSLPLSSLTIDASGPPVVQQEIYTPLSTSIPNYMPAINQQSAQSTEDDSPYQQIIPGIAHSLLYPTLSVLSSDAPRHSSTEEPFYK